VSIGAAAIMGAFITYKGYIHCGLKKLVFMLEFNLPYFIEQS